MEEASFEIEHGGEASETLVVGVSEFGLAGLTAADYIVESLGLKKTGHITTEDLPSITPFENGRPRHHTRFFSSDDVDFTVLVGEMFLPLDAARSFSDAVTEWMTDNDVSEVVFLSGIVGPHGPEQHDVFYVATDDYRDRVDGVFDPIGGGFFEGVHAELLARGIDTSVAVGVLTTPAHPPAQDIEAAVRLVEGFAEVYGVGVDTEPLEESAHELQQHYEQLAERMSTVEEESKQRFAEDRAYM
ncbi:MAG: proteasome assembly chaperone family protein [Halobacteriales archaeon]